MTAADTASASAAVGAPISRPRALFDLYRTTARIAVAREMQYRLGNVVGLMGFLFEPIILLSVWTAVAHAKGGVVNGYDEGKIAAYYIVWTLVRAFTIVFTPYGFEWRIQRGDMSAMLLRPAHPIHYDIAYFSGWKIVSFFCWIPFAVVLSVAFHPTLHLTVPKVLTFIVAIWGAYLIRSVFQWALGLITFWTTKVAAIFELYVVIEIGLSGRLVPITFLPQWAQTVADFLPFQWCYYFPIDAIVGDRSTGSLLGGLGIQVAWIVAGSGLVALVWRRAVRRYSAVGN